MTDRMKWALVGIVGFLAVGVVASLLIVAFRADASPAAQAAATTSTSLAPVAETDAQLPLTPGTTRAEVSTTTTTTKPVSTTTTKPVVNWRQLREELLAGEKKYIQELGFSDFLISITAGESNNDLKMKFKFHTLLLASGWVFVALEPGSEAYTTYYDAMSAEHPQLANLIEAAATRNLNPILDVWDS